MNEAESDAEIMGRAIRAGKLVVLRAVLDELYAIRGGRSTRSLSITDAIDIVQRRIDALKAGGA